MQQPFNPQFSRPRGEGPSTGCGLFALGLLFFPLLLLPLMALLLFGLARRKIGMGSHPQRMRLWREHRAAWEKGVPPMFAELHRRAHEAEAEKGDTSQAGAPTEE